MPASVDPVNAAIVLALLEEAPRSGYDIKREIDGRLEGLVEITSGTIYYLLKKLERRRWITGRASKRGNRPERVTYRITAAGRREFVRQVRELALHTDRFYSPFDVALYLAPKLPPEALVEAVEKRLEHLSNSLRRLRQLEARFPERWPFHLYYLREKAKEMIDVNERWCQRLKRKIQQKALSKA